MEEVEDRSAEDLITLLHRVHCDNSKLQYYAEPLDGLRKSIMPLTPFVFEFFLFNSLYQVDWASTWESTELVFHPDDFSEPQKQRAFISFIKNYARKAPSALYRAFEPLLGIEKAEGDWTRVTPDSRISIEKGDKFFSDIRQLQVILEQCKTPSDMPTNKKTFEILNDCTYFVYLVRNNIFHGSKTLGEVYDLFLKGLTSLFFLASGKDTAACDFVPCSIFSSALPSTDSEEVLDQSLILSATAKHVMKVGDSRLIARFTKTVPPPAIDVRPGEKASLFYPSAGTDFLTPMLLGFPYCTQFYFFDRGRQNNYSLGIVDILKRIKGVRFPTNHPRWQSSGNKLCLDFEFNRIPRRLNLVQDDNTAVFEEDIELKFYFHRGDSWGESGSGQKWDSELLPKLLKLIPAGSTCLYLTDGEPGGFDEGFSSEMFELEFLFIERGRKYYCGRFLGR